MRILLSSMGVLLLLVACVLLTFMLALIWPNVIEMQVDRAYNSAQDAFNDVVGNGIATLVLIGLGMAGLSLLGAGLKSPARAQKGDK